MNIRTQLKITEVDHKGRALIGKDNERITRLCGFIRMCPSLSCEDCIGDAPLSVLKPITQEYFDNGLEQDLNTWLVVLR